MSETINQKSINNAVAAYLMIFISWLLLINKNNPYINNSYVRNHVISSIILHLLILLNYIVFIHYGLGSSIIIFGVSLSTIIANIFFILIGVLLIKGIYSAIKGTKPSISSVFSLSKAINLDINNDNIFDEKDKLTIILSYIPFIGYITSSKYENEKIKNIIKFNLIATLTIIFIYIFRHNNISNLLLLVYIIYVSFTSVYLYAKNELITLSLPDFILANKSLEYLKAFLKYIYQYFKGNFQQFNIIIDENNKINNLEKEKNLEELEKYPEMKLSRNLIYIPVINLILLFQGKNKYIYHIRNGIVITCIFIVVFIMLLFNLFTVRWLILILFPITFGFGMLDIKYYKMPYIYEIYACYIKVKNILSSSKLKIDQKRKEVNEVSLKVK